MFTRLPALTGTLLPLLSVVLFGCGGPSSPELFLLEHKLVGALAETTPSGQTLRAIDIPSEDVGYSSFGILYSVARISESRGLSMVIRSCRSCGASRRASLYFSGTLGTSDVALADWDLPSAAVSQGIDHAIVNDAEGHPTEVWLFYMTERGVELRHYSLSGVPLPVSATLVSVDKFDFSVTSPSMGRLLLLRSGGLVGYWNDNSLTTVANSRLGFVYRSPAGAWSTLFPVDDSMPYPIDDRTRSTPAFGGQHNVALAQHPADDSLWAFFSGDGSNAIRAVQLKENAQGQLAVTRVRPSFISKADGESTREGENPHVIAIPSPARNSILLAYQSLRSVYFAFNTATSRVVKGGYVTVAEIASDGSKRFVTLPTSAERVSYLNLANDAEGAGFWVGYLPVDIESISRNRIDLACSDRFASHYDFNTASWDSTIRLGTANFRVDSVEESRQRALSADRSPTFGFLNRDWRFHRYELTRMPPQNAPELSLFPADGTILTGNSSVRADVSQGTEVRRVSFFVDETLTAIVTAEPYQFQWNTAKAANGPHEIHAEVTDAQGNRGVVRTSYYVANAVADIGAQINLSSPANGATVGGFKIAVNINGVGTISRADLYVDGRYSNAVSPTRPGVFPYWNSTLYADGWHTLVVKGYNLSGREIASPPITVFVDNRDTWAPGQMITAPKRNARVAGARVAVTSNAFDNIAVSRVEYSLVYTSPTTFLRVWEPIGQSSSGPDYRIEFDSTKLLNSTMIKGGYQIAAYAYDAEGNKSVEPDHNWVPLVIDNSTTIPPMPTVVPTSTATPSPTPIPTAVPTATPSPTSTPPPISSPTPASPVSLVIDDPKVTEGNSGNTVATFTVRLSAASSQSVSVKIATADRSAKAGLDYVAVAGILMFAPGERSKQISVPVIGDTLLETNETFYLNLSAATNASIADAQGQATIFNDD